MSKGWYTKHMRKATSGFTIVELLIVIVVIAILASISVVAYNGIQQRANNTRSTAAAKQLIGLIKAYTATYGTFPDTSAAVCGTIDNACTNNSNTVNTANNSTLINELRKVGNPPDSSPIAADGAYGIQYIYNASTTFNSQPAPLRIEYYLQGNAQKCGLENITTTTTGGVTANSGYSQTTGNKTTCWVMFYQVNP